MHAALSLCWHRLQLPLYDDGAGSLRLGVESALVYVYMEVRLLLRYAAAAADAYPAAKTGTHPSHFRNDSTQHHKNHNGSNQPQNI